MEPWPVANLATTVQRNRIVERPPVSASHGSMPPRYSPSATSAASIYVLAPLRKRCAPWIAHSDVREARKIASMVCTSDAAIDAYLAFGLAEAKALIIQHRAAEAPETSFPRPDPTSRLRIMKSAGMKWQ
jgi:hypothetical protein